MKTAFIIVTYKTPKKFITGLKREIKMLKLDNYKIYIIDNSADNRGYAAGVNKGLKKALKDVCEIFVVMNPDISIRKLKIKRLFDAARYFDIFGYSFDQHEVIRYGGKNDPWRMSGGLIIERPKKRFSEVDFVSGSLMVIKKKVIQKVGFFDESYFMYYEDNDFCERARRAGFKIGIDSHLVYEHFELSLDNPFKNKLLSRNRLKFLLKYGSIKQKTYELVRVPKTILENFLKS